MVDIKVTYETLFDLLRREKSKNELQEIDSTFYVDVVMYLRSKQNMLSNSSATVSRAEQEKIRIQLKNIKRILRELYEIREKKILNLAVSKVRTGSSLIDTSKLLNEERGLYEETVSILEKYKKGVLYRLTNYEIPSVSSHSTFQIRKEPEVVENDDLNEDESYPEPQVQNTQKIEIKQEVEKKEDIFDSENKKVKFLCNLPRFMGMDKKIYGPFEKGTTNELPSVVAELLYKKGRVEII